MARYAITKEEATHRYPTSLHWGDGYFGDLMRYIVADSHLDALNHKGAQAAGTELKHLQCRSDSGQWVFVSSQTL